MRLANRGTIWTDEQKQKHSDRRWGYTHTEETKQKISAGNKRKKRSEESIENMKAAQQKRRQEEFHKQYNETHEVST